MNWNVVAFYILAALTVIASIGVVGQRNPMHSVMLLITSFGSLAGLYILLDAPFSAVTQIIIYTGAIMVLFLFVVMLLNVPREEPAPPGLVAALQPGSLKIAAVLSAVIGVVLVMLLLKVSLHWFAQDPEAESVSSVARIGVSLFTRHAFAFEATSILILVAMVGAIVIARKER